MEKNSQKHNNEILRGKRQQNSVNNYENHNKRTPIDDVRFWFVPCAEGFNLNAVFKKGIRLEWFQTRFLMGMKDGDIVYIYETLPVGEIKYRGTVTKTLIPFLDSIDDSEFGRKIKGREYINEDKFFEFEFDKALPQKRITKAMLENWGFSKFQPRELPKAVAEKIEDIYFGESLNEKIEAAFEDLTSIVVNPSAPEGKKREIYTVIYERNQQNRNACISIQGTKCKVCDFDFVETYGDLGKDFIEVHHKKPLYSFDEETDVNPATDLVPVCSNCHRMLHRNKNMNLTIEDLQQIIAKNRKIIE